MRKLVSRRLLFTVLAILPVLIQHIIHETTHYVTGRLFNEPIEAFHFMTGPLLTSQVVFGTPVAERAGLHWLVIAWSPAVLTVLIGYLIFASRRRLLGGNPYWNLSVWFAGLVFLLLDPFYFAVISIVVGGGGDVGAAQIVPMSPWIVRGVALLVLVFNLTLVRRWWQEAQQEVARYQPAPLRRLEAA